MARLPLLAEKERKTDAGRRGGRKGAAPMNDRDRIEFHIFAITMTVNLAVIVIFLGILVRALC